MNCDEVSRLLDAYIDGELDDATRPELQRHLDGCHACSKEEQEIKQFRSLVRMNMPVYTAPAGLKSRIRASLRVESERSIPWFFRLRRPLAYAAAVALFGLCATLGFKILHPDREQELIGQAITNHARSLMVDHLVDVASSNARIVRPWFAGKLDYSPPVADLVGKGYTLAGGRIDMLENRAAAAIVYHRNSQVINVFIWPSENHKIDFEVRSERGYHFCAWNQAGLNFFCISAGTGDDIEKFEDEFRGDLRL